MGINHKKENRYSSPVPLAERMRPKTFDDIIGQEHITGKNRAFRKAVEQGAVGSYILWGPPGTGKTTISRIIAESAGYLFSEISAVSSGINDIRKVIHDAEKELLTKNKKTILFIDEIHRFNKTQQDALLPHVEKGTISLIGATTDNPSFEVTAPLRSRCRILKIKPLQYEDIHSILLRAINDKENGISLKDVSIEEGILENIIIKANGDARFALNTLETALFSAEEDGDNKFRLTKKTLEDVLQQTLIHYDKKGTEHYDHASAFQKSLRGSDPDAALYWLGKMLYAGEDPRFIARRLIITASEDIGNADPIALLVSNAALQVVEKIGLPEGRITLAQAAIYVATAPKSNSSISGINNVIKDIKDSGGGYPVPDHLKDSHYKDASGYGFGKGYKYPHSYPNHFIRQRYLPEKLKDTVYYSPSEEGYEEFIKKRMDKLRRM